MKELLDFYESCEFDGIERLILINDKFGLKFANLDDLRHKISRLRKKYGVEVIATEKKPSELDDYLKQKGLTIRDIDKLLYKNDLSAKKDITIKTGVKKFMVGVVSDTHLGAKTCALDELHNIYSIFAERGVKHVLHPGDLCDGGGRVYSGHAYELVVHGFDDMLKYLHNNYPKREGITTYVIGGNHDEDFIKTSGANVLRRLCDERADMEYLGMYDANIEIEGVKFGLHHGAGGGAYAYSYKLQKYVENLTGNRKPQVFLLGHYHTAVYSMIRNIHCMTCASFQKPNDFSTRLMLPNIVGGYILHIETAGDGSIVSFTPEFIPYYY